MSGWTWPSSPATGRAACRWSCRRRRATPPMRTRTALTPDHDDDGDDRQDRRAEALEERLLARIAGASGRAGRHGPCRSGWSRVGARRESGWWAARRQASAVAVIGSRSGSTCCSDDRRWSIVVARRPGPRCAGRRVASLPDARLLSGLVEPAADLGPGEAEEQQRRSRATINANSGCAGEEQQRDRAGPSASPGRAQGRATPPCAG